LSLLPSASGVCLHIRDVEEIEGDAFFSQRRSLAAPVAEQVALLAALKLRKARGRERWRRLLRRGQTAHSLVEMPGWRISGTGWRRETYFS